MKNKKVFILCFSSIVVFLLAGLISFDYYSFRDNLVKYIKKNDYEKIEKLLKARKFYSINFYIDNAEKNQRLTPLYLSVMLEYPIHRNDFRIAKLLLKNGANPKFNNKSIATINTKKILMEYSILSFILDHYNPKGNYDMEKDILEELLKAGADQDLCLKSGDEFKLSPLILSAMQGNLEFMKLFIKYKANVNFVDIHTLGTSDIQLDVLFSSLFTKHFPDKQVQFDAIRLIFENGFKLDTDKKYLLDTNKKQTIMEIISERPFQPELVKYLEEKIAEAKKQGSK